MSEGQTDRIRDRRPPSALLAVSFAVSFAVLCAGLVPAAASAEGSPPTDDRLRTVILGLVPRRGVDDKQLAAALSDVVQSVYARDGRRIVIGRDDIARVLELEADRQAAGCDSDKCLAELGQALDAQRIVTGSIDKLGDGFMITVAEIDGKTLEPLARAQERVPNDENAMVDACTRLAGELVQTSGARAAARVFGNSGSVEIESDPRNARVVLSGTEMGATPTKIDNVATGTQKLRLIREDYEAVEIDVPVYPGGTTRVTVEMRILRDLAAKNFEVRQAAWRDKSQWHTVGAWTKAGIGTVVGAAGGIYALTNARDKDGGAIIGGLLTAGLGASIVAWGAIDLLNPPPAPVPEWEIERKVVVKPPAGQGEEQVKVLQQGSASNAAK